MSAALNISGPCQLCWTVSWAPIPEDMKEKCALKHPHEGEHVLCEHCELLASYERLVIQIKAYPLLEPGEREQWAETLQALVAIPGE